MKTQEMEAYVKKFDAQLDEMDAKARSMEASDRAEYERARDNFKGQLNAWQDYGEAKWDEFTANIEQGWRDLQARWNR